MKRFWEHARTAGIVAWVAVCLLVGGPLLAGHLLTLAVPAAGDPAIAATRTPADAGQWLALHVRSAECRCSG